MLSSIDAALPALALAKKPAPNTPITPATAADNASPASDATPPVSSIADIARHPLDPALFNHMLKYFQEGDKRADVNGDGQLTVADFGAFQTKYALGINPFDQPAVAVNEPAPAINPATDPVTTQAVVNDPAPPALPPLFALMQRMFMAGDKRADINGDGQLNVADFGAFQTKYAMGINPFEEPSTVNDPAPAVVSDPVTTQTAANDPAPALPAIFNRMIKYFIAGDKRADINGDGQLNIADFGAFQTKYAMGINPFGNPFTDPLDSSFSGMMREYFAASGERTGAAGISYNETGKFLPGDTDSTESLLNVIS